MELEPVNGVPYKSSTADGSKSSSAGLADDFDTFLLLLTTQLQNQDPLAPMDTEKFTQQLVQFAGVEQNIKTNDRLEELIALQNNERLHSAVSFIGKTVAADSLVLSLEDGKSTITYDLGGDAKEVTILVVDENGDTVRAIEGSTDFGHHQITWDGKDDDGNTVDDGLYGFLVSAVDFDNRPVTLIQGTIGTVTSIEAQNGEIVLSMGELALPLSRVTKIMDNYEPPALPPTGGDTDPPPAGEDDPPPADESG